MAAFARRGGGGRDRGVWVSRGSHHSSTHSKRNAPPDDCSRENIAIARVAGNHRGSRRPTRLGQSRPQRRLTPRLEIGRERVRSKNETPKCRLGDSGPKSRFGHQFAHTETSPYVRNAAMSRHFELI
jgi:hypothetical protein